LVFKYFILYILLLVKCISLEAKVHKNAVQSSIVTDYESGEVMYENHADKLTYPASLTKIMTLMILFDAIEEGRVSFNTMMNVSKYASSQMPTKLYLKAGQRISVRDSILALITKSANDAAVVIAEHLSGSEAAFAKKMNVKAREFGMYNTHFKNASGCPDMQQRTTARDMSRMSMALIEKYSKYYDLFKTESFVYRGVRHKNHNRLLGALDGVDGIKTGLTDASGFNLAASCVRDGKRVIAVVMGGKSSQARDSLASQLINAGFSSDYNLYEKKYPGLIDASYNNNSCETKTKARLVSTSKRESVAAQKKWVIQVGAHKSYDMAQDATIKGLMALSNNYNVQAKVLKQPAKKRYRALLSIAGKENAINACKMLKKNGITCIVSEERKSAKIYTASATRR
jgi:D-alanyl-D-alanine carboxypeptidase